MPKVLNRLLALSIAEQNQLFAELEERIAAPSRAESRPPNEISDALAPTHS